MKLLTFETWAWKPGAALVADLVAVFSATVPAGCKWVLSVDIKNLHVGVGEGCMTQLDG